MSPPVPPALPDIETILNTPADQLPRNKLTEEIHQKEVWWQIYAPIAGGCLLVLVAGGLAIAAGFSSNGAATRVWADVSLAFVILQVMVGVLPLLIVLAGLALGLVYVIRKLPPYFKVAQDYSSWLAYKTEWATKFVVQPVLKIKAGAAGLDGFIQGIRKFFRT